MTGYSHTEAERSAVTATTTGSKASEGPLALAADSSSYSVSSPAFSPSALSSATSSEPAVDSELAVSPGADSSSDELPDEVELSAEEASDDVDSSAKDEEDSDPEASVNVSTLGVSLVVVVVVVVVISVGDTGVTLGVAPSTALRAVANAAGDKPDEAADGEVIAFARRGMTPAGITVDGENAGAAAVASVVSAVVAVEAAAPSVDPVGMGVFGENMLMMEDSKPDSTFCADTAVAAITNSIQATMARRVVFMMDCVVRMGLRDGD